MNLSIMPHKTQEARAGDTMARSGIDRPRRAMELTSTNAVATTLDTRRAHRRKALAAGTQTGEGLLCTLKRISTTMDKPVLTSAELDYINELVGGSSAESGDGRSGFTIDGGERANGLMLQLAAKANLTLEAELEDYCMSFPLQLHEDEFHSLQLQLAPPTIYERGPVLRAWRLHLDEPLPLLSDDGHETALSVHELSPNGLLVDTGPKHQSPKHLHVRLALPGEDPFKIDARRIRDTEDGMTAYEVDYPLDKDAERIRSYLYQAHQRLHPELQPELPAEMRAEDPERS